MKFIRTAGYAGTSRAFAVAAMALSTPKILAKRMALRNDDAANAKSGWELW